VERFNISSYEIVNPVENPDEKFAGNFTSSIEEYYIPEHNTTGFFKNIWLDDHDIAEVITSELLQVAGIPCAKVVLAQHRDTNGVLSFNVLKENEEFVDSLGYHVEREGNKFGIKEFIEDDLNFCSQTREISPEFIQERINHVLNETFIRALFCAYDLGLDNMQPALNKKTGELRNVAHYDFGGAFSTDETMLFREGEKKRTYKEILNELYENYFPEIKDIAFKLNNALTPEKIDTITWRYANNFPQVKDFATILKAMMGFSREKYEERASLVGKVTNCFKLTGGKLIKNLKPAAIIIGNTFKSLRGSTKDKLTACKENEQTSSEEDISKLSQGKKFQEIKPQ
jgi:hypothetical protein